MQPLQPPVLNWQPSASLTMKWCPFYLVKFVPSYVATMGGVKTDASCQALGENGSVIPGLFAVGEATHRFMYNRSFVRHCSNSSALTMGRLTGAALATA